MEFGGAFSVSSVTWAKAPSTASGRSAAARAARRMCVMVCSERERGGAGRGRRRSGEVGRRLARRGAGTEAGRATARADATARERRHHHGDRERERKGGTGRVGLAPGASRARRRTGSPSRRADAGERLGRSAARDAPRGARPRPAPSRRRSPGPPWRGRRGPSARGPRGRRTRSPSDGSSGGRRGTALRVLSSPHPAPSDRGRPVASLLGRSRSTLIVK